MGGGKGLRIAAQRFNHATRAYSKALRVFSDFILYGKLPENSRQQITRSKIHGLGITPVLNTAS